MVSETLLLVPFGASPTDGANAGWCLGANTGAVPVPVPDTLGMSYIIIGRKRAQQCIMHHVSKTPCAFPQNVYCIITRPSLEPGVLGDICKGHLVSLQ